MRFDLLTRTIVGSALASALVVTIIVATRHTRSVKASDDSDGAPMTPIAAEHKRCKELGLDATSDDACGALWAKDHDQFFGLNRPRQPRPANPSPATPDRKGETAPAVPDGLDISHPKSLESLDGK
jgi:conjugative transfer region protein TrbK